MKGSGIVETRLAMFSDSHMPTAAATRGINKPNSMIGTDVSVVAT